jgi:dephospho-CoA kinase
MARRDRIDPRPPLRIALTGGIASGKSTVAGLFGALGVPVIDTDQIAREVVEPGTPGLAAVVARFGPQVLGDDGRLDRRALRERIFSDADARRDLEALLHPLIRARVAALSAAAGGDYQLIVVPLLVETGSQAQYDRVLVVDCEPQLQRARLLVRDAATPAQADAILAAQASREARLAVAHDVIRNDGALPALARQVGELHARYRGLSADRPTTDLRPLPR